MNETHTPVAACRILAFSAQALTTAIALSACGASNGAGDAALRVDSATPGLDSAVAVDAGCEALDAAPGTVLLPTPTGPFGVSRGGRRTFVDHSRADPVSDGGVVSDGGAGDRGRALSVELYFPTESCRSGEAAPYLDPVELPVLGTGAQGHQFRGHAMAKAPFAGGLGRRPLLLFSPGYAVLPREYSVYLEEMASQGYVVASISHTDWTPITVFADGSTRPGVYDPNRLPWKVANDQALVWIADAAFVLDSLASIDAHDPLGEVEGHLDLDRVGMFGHSFGGMTAVNLAARDARVKAGLNFDGTVYGPAPSMPIPRPIFLFRSDRAADPTYDQAFNQAMAGAWILTLSDSEHLNFSDFGVLVAGVGHDLPDDSLLLGAIDPTRAVVVTRAYLVAFFGKTLGGTSSALLDAQSPDYPEIGWFLKK